MKIERLANIGIKTGFYLLFTLVPLLLTPWNYELFEYNKMMAVYVVTALIVTSWIVKMIAQKEIRIAKTPLDIPIALFVASQLVSALFSIDPHVSWLGYYSRFNGGMWSIISYVLLYYAFISNHDVFSRTNDESKIKNKESGISMIHDSIAMILKVALATGTLVAIYGVLERLGIDKNLWVQDVQNRVFSTLGQPNWLAAYLVALIPVTFAFMLTGRKKFDDSSVKAGEKYVWSTLDKRVWLTSRDSSILAFGVRFFRDNIQGILAPLVSILFFVVLLFTRSRSGLFGLVIADVVFWLLVWLRSPTGLRSLKKTTLILHAVFALIVFFNGTGIEKIDKYFTWKGLSTKQEATKATPATAGPALEVGGTESGVIRKYVWQGAINAWRSTTKTLLIGTGVETYAFAFYQFRPAGHNMTSEWDFLYNKAHNEYLNYLATTGLFGLGSYLLFIGVFIVWYVRYGVRGMGYEEYKRQSTNNLLMPHNSSLLTHALFAGWISILVTNFFGFSVVIVQVFLFLFPAMIITTATTQQNNDTTTQKILLPGWTIWFAIFIGLIVVFKIGSFWYADSLFASGYHASRANNIEAAVPQITHAIQLNEQEPFYHDELASTYASLAVAAAESKNATEAAQLASLATEENGKALSISPHNVNFWKTRTKIYYTLSALDPTLNAQAIDALEHARTLSPNDPKIYYNLAILMGRQGDTQKAVANLLQSKKLKSNYRDAYFALWVFYSEMKQPDKAKSILQEYLDNIDPTDKDFLEKIK